MAKKKSKKDEDDDYFSSLASASNIESAVPTNIADNDKTTNKCDAKSKKSTAKNNHITDKNGTQAVNPNSANKGEVIMNNSKIKTTKLGNDIKYEHIADNSEIKNPNNDTIKIETDKPTLKTLVPSRGPKKAGTSIADIKKILAAKRKAQEEYEKECERIEQARKELEGVQLQQKDKKMTEVKASTLKTSKPLRYSFMRQQTNFDKSEATTKKDADVFNKPNIENKPTKFDTNLKSPICCILGHVDTGKTKLLDKLRETNVQLGEAGGITQQIGATFFPAPYLHNKCNISTSLPGILIIDTPGHESFTNLRSRGSSLCNIAILVVDIMHGLEPQTIESINLLKSKRTPFIVALNKIDRIYKWRHLPNKENKFKRFEDSFNEQDQITKSIFNEKIQENFVAFSEVGLNVKLFTDNPDQRKFINVIPTSAITGEGIPDLICKIIDLSERFMIKKMKYTCDLECTILEVKTIEGHGSTIDVILSNGELNENDKICVCGFDGPIVTTIKALLIPEPCRESRVKGFVSIKNVKASLGVKIAGNGLDKAICGTNIIKILNDEDEAKKMVLNEFDSIIKSIETVENGVHVQASTLGSLEALILFLKSSNIPVSSVSIGKVRKRDVVRACCQEKTEHRVMLCFDIKIEKEYEDLAESGGVKIFNAAIIYHLFDSYKKFASDLRQQQKIENLQHAIYPCKLRILPNCVWNKRSPLVMGVEVQGILKVNVQLSTENKIILGRVTSIENNKKCVESAVTGDKVAIKIETDGMPRMFGRHFNEEDMIYSVINRKSIDVLKEHFKEDLKEDDWKLVVELKKIFDIL